MLAGERILKELFPQEFPGSVTFDIFRFFYLFIKAHIFLIPFSFCSFYLKAGILPPFGSICSGLPTLWLFQ